MSFGSKNEHSCVGVDHSIVDKEIRVHTSMRALVRRTQTARRDSVRLYKPRLAGAKMLACSVANFYSTSPFVFYSTSPSMRKPVDASRS
jgi:hypothetical protein